MARYPNWVSLSPAIRSVQRSLTDTDGRTDRRVDGETDGTGRRVDGWTDRGAVVRTGMQAERRIDALVEAGRWMDGQTDRWTGRTDRQTPISRVDEQVDGRANEKVERQTDGGGRTDRRTNGAADGRVADKRAGRRTAGGWMNRRNDGAADGPAHETQVPCWVPLKSLMSLQCHPFFFVLHQPEKVYVTHKMEENKEKIWKLLEDGGHLYVCG